MKYYTATSIITLAGADLSNPRPMPQVSFSSFDLGGILSSLPKPTGGVDSGSGFSIPSLGGILPTAILTGGSGHGASDLSSIDLGGLFSSLPKPTGGVGSGSGFSIPSLGEIVPTASPGGSGHGSSGLPSFAIPTATVVVGGGVTSLPSSSLPTTISQVESGSEGTNASTSVQPSANGGAVSSDCTVQSTKGGSTENGVADKNCCTDLTVVFARGTTEPGNVGVVAGPNLFASLRSKVCGKITVQGVDFPADSAGNSNLGASGGPALASLVKAAKSQCPNTKIIVSGYSQGAMVVHDALNAQGISTANGIIGAVLFGDPLKTQKIGDLAKDKIKEFCGTTDSICGTGDNPTGGHTSYGTIGEEAATWTLSAAGLA